MFLQLTVCIYIYVYQTFLRYQMPAFDLISWQYLTVALQWQECRYWLVTSGHWDVRSPNRHSVGHRNYSVQLHRDANKRGISCMLALGRSMLPIKMCFTCNLRWYSHNCHGWIPNFSIPCGAEPSGKLLPRPLERATFRTSSTCRSGPATEEPAGHGWGITTPPWWTETGWGLGNNMMIQWYNGIWQKYCGVYWFMGTTHEMSKKRKPHGTYYKYQIQ